MLRKTFSVKKIYSICFLAFMLVMGIVPMFLLFQDNLLKEGETINKTTKSFSKLYPFDDDTTNSSIDNDSFSFPAEYWDVTQNITSTISSALTSRNPLSNLFKNLPKSYYRFLNGSVILNGSYPFVELPNGYIAGCFGYYPSTKTYANILDFSTWLKERSIPYLTLITPDKSDDNFAEFPTFIPQGYSQLLDEYKDFLNENEFQYIESTPILLAENNDFFSWFYISDPHWNVHAALRMALETATVLNENLNISADTDALNKSKFELSTYPNSFLSNYGKKLGNAWTEDMEVLYPETKTNFHIEIPSEGIDKTGCFEDTLIDQSHLGETSSYLAFLYDNYPLIHIENLNCDNETRILVIKYSFGNSFCTYLANSVQYLDVIDPRFFDGSIRSYIEQTNPDIVILCTGVISETDDEYLQLK